MSNGNDDTEEGSDPESGRYERRGLDSVYGLVASIMKELNVSYDDVMYKIPWGKLLRMMVDSPRHVYVKGGHKRIGSKDSNGIKENIVVTEENSQELLNFIDEINGKKKRRYE